MVTQEIYQRALDNARKDLADGHDIEFLVEGLKFRGLNQVECIRAVLELKVSSPSEAKGIVHYSRAWSATRAESESFQAYLAEVVNEEFGNDNPPRA